MMTKEKLQNKIIELQSIDDKDGWELGQLNVLEAWLLNMKKQEKIIDKSVLEYETTDKLARTIFKELKYKLFVGEVKGK